jgi:uncharacterized protein YbjT (DUF2867 family)
MTVVITGATGTVGSRVVGRILSLGRRPRVFVRSADKARALFGDRVDVVVGDLAGEAPPLADAFAGAEAVFLVNDGPDLARRDETAAAAARMAGVKRLVKLSSMDARRAHAVGAWHARGEAAIRACGVAWTFVRPVGFMSNALAWARSIQGESVVRSSAGDGRIAMIHPDDIADVAARALTSSAHEGEALEITGPEALGYAEMVTILGEVLEKRIAYRSLTDEEARQHLLGRGTPAPVAEALVALWRSIREGGGAIVTDTVERVLGALPRSFRQWARENSGRFR